MPPKQRTSRRKVRTQTVVELSEEKFASERTELLNIAAMLERLAAEIKKLFPPRD